MPRDSEGTFSLVNGVNPTVDDTPISANWANPTLSDVAAELTNSLDRDGNGGMLAAFKNSDGTVSLPGMAWATELDSGFYRAAAGDWRAAINGVTTTRFVDDTSTTAGEQEPFEIWDGSAWFAPLTTNGGATPAFTALTAESGLTVSAGGLTVTTGGVDVTAGAVAFSGDVEITGNLLTTGTISSNGRFKNWVYGFVDSAGNVDLDSGITVDKADTGEYAITFDGTLFNSGSSSFVLATAGGFGSDHITAVTWYDTTSGVAATYVWKVNTYNTSSGAAQDAPFSVMAYVGSYTP